MKIKKSELKNIINESIRSVRTNNRKLNQRQFADKVFENVNNYLTELSHQTILNAVEANKKKANILKQNDKEVTENALKDWLKDKTPAQQKRYYKLWKEGKLSDLLKRHAHLFGTVANTGLEWVREHTDVPISPEFFEGNEASWGKGYKNTTRKPTKDEHDFYRFVTSCMEDMDGMTEEQIQRYTNAFMGFVEYTISL